MTHEEEFFYAVANLGASSLRTLTNALFAARQTYDRDEKVFRHQDDELADIFREERDALDHLLTLIKKSFQ